MSKMEELIKKMENDTAFVAELKQASSAEELAAKLKAAGFHITPEELLQVLTPAESDELSDDELEAAAGGYTNVSTPIYSLSDEEVKFLLEAGFKLTRPSRPSYEIETLRPNVDNYTTK